METKRAAKGFDSRRYYNGLFRASISFILVVASGGVLSAQVSPQTPSRPASTPSAVSLQKRDAEEASITGTIKGNVVSDNGQPITNATVTAQSVTGRFVSTAKAVDAKGEFVFEQLPVALYTISGIAPGYQDQTLTIVDPAQPPRYLIGARVRVVMIKGGVITGSVSDSNGAPVVGVPVRTFLSAPSTSLPDMLGQSGSSETDDRGIYRLYGLLPGQYVVVAGGNRAFFSASGFDRDSPTFYPSSSRATAIPVAVRSGEESTGIDIKYRGAEGHSISGVVLGVVDPNVTFGATIVTIAPAGTLSTIAFGIAGPAEQRGGFSFNGIDDGEYDLFAGFQVGSDNSTVATKRVTVRGADVAGVELTLAPLGSISGALALDPTKPDVKCDSRASHLIETSINAPREDSKKSGNQLVNAFARSAARLNEKGEFAFRNLEVGKYRLEIKLPTDAWYVRAISRPGLATKLPQINPNQSGEEQTVISIKAGERVNGLSIAIAQDAAGLRGRLGLTPGVVPVGTTVHLVPTEREAVNNTLRYSEARVNSDSTFAFTNIAPGRYLIMSRVDSPDDAGVLSSRPVTWNPGMRTRLRRDAEAAKTVVELKPCQRAVDYVLKSSTAQ